MASSSKKVELESNNNSCTNKRLSTESRESSYMGFDRGIDSDIEIDAPATPTPQGGIVPGGTEPNRCSSEPHLKKKMVLTPKLARWESLDPPDPNESDTLLPADLKPPELNPTVVNANTKNPIALNFLPKDNNNKVECAKVVPNHKSVSGDCQNLQEVLPTTQLPAEPLTSVGSFTSIATPSVGTDGNLCCFYGPRSNEHDSLVIMLSGIYAKLLIVMGLCFPLAEVISKQIPVSYYEGFYLYLYAVSIAFLSFVYVFILRAEASPRKKDKSRLKLKSPASCLRIFLKKRTPAAQNPNHHHSSRSSSTKSLEQKQGQEQHNPCGNFYLRLGAVGFGVGSMIYSGLEFGQFFELERGSHCYNILYSITPTARMALTFVQMYFIFLNSRIAIKKYKALARFGLMHLIATNICVWLHILVQETKHGILTLINVNMSAPLAAHIPLNILAEALDDVNATRVYFENGTYHSRAYRSIQQSMPYIDNECRRSNIMGELVQEASHFLFPCSIQYNLVCSAILYIMWRNIGKTYTPRCQDDASTRSSLASHQRSNNQVDCAKANKGLFSGILVLVLSIISIILFFVLIGKPEYQYLAIIEAHITELVLYLVTSLAVGMALLQVRELKYNSYHNAELDNLLLIVAQSGLYLFTMFSIVGGHFTNDENTLLVLVTSLACLIQATLQTIFILDASRRYARTSHQARHKPGRELVTFLLVCNFAMWAMNTLQTQRADSNPVQLKFYGFWAWTIITHVTTPLAIYFRFHSIVCLCDIWKRTYEMKPDYL